MSSPISVTTQSVAGFTASVTQLEAAGPEIYQLYKNAVNKIKDILLPYPPTEAVNLTNENKLDLEASIDVLKNILVGGYQPAADARKQFLTSDMATQLQFLLISLKPYGLTGAQFAFNGLESAQGWQNLVSSSSILADLFNFVESNSNRTLQSMIELEYVKTGNNLLSEQLGSLESALSLTKTALDNLASLQHLHNQVSIDNISTFTNRFNLAGTGLTIAQFQAMYEDAAKAFFGVPVIPSISMMNLDPTKNFDVVTNIPPNVSAIHPDDIGGFLGPGAAHNALETTSRNLILPWNSPSGPSAKLLKMEGLVYAQYNAFTDHYDLYTNKAGLHAPTLIATGVEFSGAMPAGKPTNFTMLLDNGDALTAGAAATLQFMGNMGASRSVGIAMDVGTVDQTGFSPLSNYFITPDSASALNLWLTNTAWVQNIRSADGTVNNLVQLSGLKNYYGIKNDNDPNIQGAMSFLTNPFIRFYHLNPPPFPDGSYLGFSRVTSSFEWDTVNRPQAFLDAKNELVRLREDIKAQIAELTPITPLLPNGTEDPNTLLAKLKKVLKDIQDNFKYNGADITSATGFISSFSAFTKWMVDGYGGATVKGGAYQQNITFAITAGQSLNDTQNESVRRFLFIFEEYYKSASAILQKITQILERVAQGISR